MITQLKQQDEMLTLPQAAQILHVSEQTLRNYVEQDKIDAYATSGGHKRFLPQDVQLLMSRLRNPGKEHGGYWETYTTIIWDTNGRDFNQFRAYKDDGEPVNIEEITENDLNTKIKWFNVLHLRETAIESRRGMIINSNQATINFYKEMHENNTEIKTTIVPQIELYTWWHEERQEPITNFCHNINIMAYNKEDAQKELFKQIMQFPDTIAKQYEPVTGIVSLKRTTDGRQFDIKNC